MFVVGRCGSVGCFLGGCGVWGCWCWGCSCGGALFCFDLFVAFKKSRRERPEPLWFGARHRRRPVYLCPPIFGNNGGCCWDGRGVGAVIFS